jgi:hypothetical protein
MFEASSDPRSRSKVTTQCWDLRLRNRRRCRRRGWGARQEAALYVTGARHRAWQGMWFTGASYSAMETWRVSAERARFGMQQAANLSLSPPRQPQVRSHCTAGRPPNPLRRPSQLGSYHSVTVPIPKPVVHTCLFDLSSAGWATVAAGRRPTPRSRRKDDEEEACC